MPKVLSIREENNEEKKLREQIEEAESLSNKGQTYLAHDDLDRALALYQESLRLYEQISASDSALGKQGKAASLSNIAQISLRRGDLDLAQDLYQESLHLYEQLGASNDTFSMQGKAKSLSQLANIYWEKKDSEQAQHLMEEAIELGRKADDLEGIAYDITKLGQLSQARGDQKTALAHYREGLEIFEKLGAQPMVVDLHKMIASLEDGALPSSAEKRQSGGDPLTQLITQADNAAERGEIQSAIQFQEQAVALARELNNPKALIGQLVNLAQYYAMGERFNEAVSLLEESLNTGKAISHPELNTIRQLHETLSSIASLSSEEQAVVRDQQSRVQIENAANQARDAGLAYIRKQAPRRDVLNWLEQTAEKLKDGESAGLPRLEVIALFDALAALIKEESIPPVPTAYASHFSAVQNELKKIP